MRRWQPQATFRGQPLVSAVVFDSLLSCSTPPAQTISFALYGSLVAARHPYLCSLSSHPTRGHYQHSSGVPAGGRFFTGASVVAGGSFTAPAPVSPPPCHLFPVSPFRHRCLLLARCFVPVPLQVLRTTLCPVDSAK